MLMRDKELGLKLLIIPSNKGRDVQFNCGKSSSGLVKGTETCSFTHGDAFA